MLIAPGAEDGLGGTCWPGPWSVAAAILIREACSASAGPTSIALAALLAAAAAGVKPLEPTLARNVRSRVEQLPIVRPLF